VSNAIKFESEARDFVDCSCGNTVMQSGFMSVDANGIDCEPDAEGFWQGHLRCDACGAIGLPTEVREGGVTH